MKDTSERDYNLDALANAILNQLNRFINLLGILMLALSRDSNPPKKTLNRVLNLNLLKARQL